jgi:phage repressor protein C with HTH and peptisase S24 domain
MGATERVKQFIENKGISKYEFCKKLGFSNKFLDNSSNMGTDKAGKILHYFPDLNAEWLLTGEGNMIKTKNARDSDSLEVSHKVSQNQYNTKNANNVILLNEEEAKYVKTFMLKTDKRNEHQIIPIYNLEASAGLVKLLDSPMSHNIIDYISIPNLPNCDGAVFVTGDSMYPLLKSGDIVAYKQIHDIINDIFFGEMYILSLQLSGEELVTIKYVQKSEIEGHIKLVSQNRHHDDKDVPLTKIRALALIKASIRYNMMY